MSITRRDVLKASLGALGTLAAASTAARAFDAVCRSTPAQTEGPFYPVSDQFDKDNDLVTVRGQNGRAQGELIYIVGQVTDEACAPVERALVEIWQACASGRYNHPGDENPAPLDPNFQFWGRAVTDANGQYRFRTIIPGAYPADSDWVRPPHIHFKVHRKGFHELTTQLYFEGHELNARDHILNSIPAAERSAVITKLELDSFDPVHRVGRFDLRIRRVR